MLLLCCDNVDCYSLWKAVSFLKRLNIDLLCDLEVPLLKNFPENIKTVIQKETCSTMFTVALFLASYRNNLSAPDKWVDQDVL